MLGLLSACESVADNEPSTNTDDEYFERFNRNISAGSEKKVILPSKKRAILLPQRLAFGIVLLCWLFAFWMIY